MASAWAAFDIILTPTLALPPPRLGEIAPSNLDVVGYLPVLRHWGAFTAIANTTGQPAASLPLFLSDHGLPIGVQAMGRFGADCQVLQLASQLEHLFIGMPAMQPDQLASAIR